MMNDTYSADNGTENTDVAQQAAVERSNLAALRKHCPKLCASLKKRELLNNIESEMLFEIRDASNCSEDVAASTNEADLSTVVPLWREKNNELHDQAAKLRKALGMLKRNTSSKED